LLERVKGIEPSS